MGELLQIGILCPFAFVLDKSCVCSQDKWSKWLMDGRTSPIVIYQVLYQIWDQQKAIRPYLDSSIDYFPQCLRTKIWILQ